MWKDKDEEQFRQDVGEHSGIVARQQMRVTNAKIVGGTGITTAVSTKYRRKMKLQVIMSPTGLSL